MALSSSSIIIEVSNEEDETPIKHEVLPKHLPSPDPQPLEFTTNLNGSSEKKKKTIIKIILLMVFLIGTIGNFVNNISTTERMAAMSQIKNEAKSKIPIELVLQQGPTECFVNNETLLVTIVCKDAKIKRFALATDFDFENCI